MHINKAAFGALITACVVTGAGGAYLTTRRAPQSPSTTPSATAVTATAPVEESGAVVSEGASAPSSATPSSKAQRTGDEARGVHARAASGDTRRSDTPPPAPVPDGPEPPRDVHPGALPAADPVAQAQPEPGPALPPGPVFVELVVSAESVIGLQMETSVSSEGARIEDQVAAQVTRDVKVGDRVAIPSGAKAYGEVTLVERGGRFRSQARLGVRFTSIVLSDGARVPIDTDVIIRVGSSPSQESAAKIGGSAIGGAIMGGLLGGGKGAILGGSLGAGAGTTAAMAGGRNPATLAAGAPVTVRLQRPATVTVEK